MCKNHRSHLILLLWFSFSLVLGQQLNLLQCKLMSRGTFIETVYSLNNTSGMQGLDVEKTIVTDVVTFETG